MKFLPRRMSGTASQGMAAALLVAEPFKQVAAPDCIVEVEVYSV